AQRLRRDRRGPLRALRASPTWRLRTRTAFRFIDSLPTRCYQSALRQQQSTCLHATTTRSGAGRGRGGILAQLERSGPERAWCADVAQSVERLTCNQQVAGSTPAIGSASTFGRTERCPSGQREQTVNLPANAFGGSNPPLSIVSERVNRTNDIMRRGSSSDGRARAFQARGRRFHSRLPLAQLG